MLPPRGPGAIARRVSATWGWGSALQADMARYAFHAPRLFVEADLAAGAAVTLGGEQANYLRNVLRLDSGDAILVFNGRDGEWRAELAASGKREVKLRVGSPSRTQEGGPDIAYLF